MFTRTLLIALLVPTLAVAGPLDEKKAEAHLKAVANGDLAGVMADYAPDARVDWVGGPLDGLYAGKEAIQDVWKKFFDANDGKPRKLELGKIESYADVKGASVEAGTSFGGKTPVKVWHLMVYRDGVMSTEIWQVSPKLKIEH